MVERVASQARDAEPGVGQCYRAQLEQREDLIERQHSAPPVIKAPDDFELCPQASRAHLL